MINNKRILEIVLEGCRKTILGSGLTFFESNGSVLFEMREASGDIVSGYVCYIIPTAKIDGKIPRYAIQFNLLPSNEEVIEKLEGAVIEFIFRLCIKTDIRFDPDGGDVGVYND